jgi:hypothetical protein
VKKKIRLEAEVMSLALGKVRHSRGKGKMAVCLI